MVKAVALWGFTSLDGASTGKEPLVIEISVNLLKNGIRWHLTAGNPAR